MLKKLTNKIYYMNYNKQNNYSIIGLIIGENSSMIVDSGSSKEQMNQFLKYIENIDMPKLKYLVLTHSHNNHIAGATELNLVNIVNGVTNEKIKQKFLKHNLNINTDIIYDEFLKIDLGDLIVELERIPSDHAKDCSIVNIPSEKIVFLGDSLYSNNNYKEETFTVEFMIPLLKELQCYEADQYIASHGPIYSSEEFLNYSEKVIKIGKISKKEKDFDSIIEKAKEKYIIDEDIERYINAFLNGKK